MKYTIKGKQLIDALKTNNLLVSFEKTVEDYDFYNISYNSKQIDDNTLFIAKGFNFKSEYLLEAKNNGATAYVAEKLFDINLPSIVVNDSRKALAIIAKTFYGYVPGKPVLIGITGTKGKTTTSFFVKNAIAAATNKPCGYSSSINMFNGKETIEVERTTPESPEAFKLFSESLDNGCDNVVIELSSVAEKYARLEGMEFEYGILTNIAEDHISDAEHHSFEEYLGFKLDILKKYHNSVLNLDDSYYQKALEVAKNSNRIITYSTKNKDADIYADQIKAKGLKTSFVLHWNNKCENVVLNMPGEFNVSNALAAFSITKLMGLDSDKVIDALESTSVEARTQILTNKEFTVIVDYAHNGVSIDALIEMVKEYYPGKIINIIIGGDGDRGLCRRHDVAKIAAQKCNKVYLSHQSTIREDPNKIIDEVEYHLKQYEANYTIIKDRIDCIKCAIEDLKSDEILLVVGKGTEHDIPTDQGNVYYKGDYHYCEKYLNLK